VRRRPAGLAKVAPAERTDAKARNRGGMPDRYRRSRGA